MGNTHLNNLLSTMNVPTMNHTANQSSIYNHLFKEQFDGNDALEDVKALRKILFESSLSLSRKNIIENSSVISAPHAVANMLYLDQRHELLLTFSDNLFNVTDTGPIKRSMAQNIADSDLSYDDLHKLYTRLQGLVEED